MFSGKCRLTCVICCLSVTRLESFTKKVNNKAVQFHFSRYMSDSRLIDSGGRVKVVTQMLSSGDTETALSILSIDNVHLADRGNYTCKPASGGQASISLHVLEGTIITSC